MRAIYDILTNLFSLLKIATKQIQFIKKNNYK